MKKYISIILMAVMLLVSLSACGKENATNSIKDEKIQIVTTIFPEYDWVREILGDNLPQAEITMLLDNGVDLHSYQPTAEDIMKISECDLFIYVGGESDGWVEDALKEAVNKDIKVVNLIEALGDEVKEEEMVDGMQESEHHHSHHEDLNESMEHEKENDEHVWLSLKNAEILCNEISGALQKIDSDNAQIYETNTSVYIEKLKELDNEYQNAVCDTAKNTIVFGDRFPFRYLADDYGLEYYAAFAGCSAEAEASFETVTFLAQKIDEHNLKTILTLERSDGKIATTIIQNTNDKNQTILQMDSMQSVTLDDVKNGITYLSVMESNLNVLKEALQ